MTRIIVCLCENNLYCYNIEWVMMILSEWHHIPAALGWLIGGRVFWESVTNENGHISMNFASIPLASFWSQVNKRNVECWDERKVMCLLIFSVLWKNGFVFIDKVLCQDQYIWGLSKFWRDHRRISICGLKHFHT